MIVIEGKKITNREALWEELHKKMPFPDYFGNNLDALADVLSEKREKYQVKVLDSDVIEENLGNYGKIFLDILEQYCVVEK